MYKVMPDVVEERKHAFVSLSPVSSNWDFNAQDTHKYHTINWLGERE